MMRFAQEKGLAGVVVDGCLRDLDGIQKLTMPIFAKGVTPQGPYKNGPGEVNIPISCGGQVIFPGDILIGDRDGLLLYIHKKPKKSRSLPRRRRLKRIAHLHSWLLILLPMHKHTFKQLLREWRVRYAADLTITSSLRFID